MYGLVRTGNVIFIMGHVGTVFLIPRIKESKTTLNYSINIKKQFHKTTEHIAYVLIIILHL